MSDLTDELRQLAADATMHARPMAVADVIRRGNRRRTRTIAQRSIGGLSAVGLGAAVLFTGVGHHPASDPAAAGSTAGGNALTVSSTSAAGHLAVDVKYRDRPAGKIKIVSVTYSGDSKKALKHPILVFSFGPGLIGGPPGWKPVVELSLGIHLRPGQLRDFSGSLPAKVIKTLDQHGGLPGNESLRIVLGSQVSRQPVGKKPHTGQINASITAAVILTR